MHQLQLSPLWLFAATVLPSSLLVAPPVYGNPADTTPIEPLYYAPVPASANYVVPTVMVSSPSPASIQAPASTVEAHPAVIFSHSLQTAVTEPVDPARPDVAAPSTRAADLRPASQPPTVTSQSPPESSSPNPTPSATELVGGSGGKLNIPLGKDDKPFSFGFGSRLPDVSALNGVTRERTVLSGSHQSSVLYITNYFRQRFNDTQSLLLETAIDPHLFGFDFGYTYTTANPHNGFAVNVFNQQSWVPVFRGGDPDVKLPNGETPWIDRLGGGIELFRNVGTDLDLAVGFNYQRVAVRDSWFTSNLSPVDEFGNPLTVSSHGIDDLLTLNFVMQYSGVDDLNNPTKGTKARIGIDQALPIGDSSIAFTRFAGNVAQFIPLNLFGFGPGPRTLILNFQAGTMVGDVPPYEAFTLGGTSSVRGYDKGAVGTGRSFVQVSAEYRFPLFSFNAFKLKWDVSGSLFLDYATALGTQDSVFGKPGVVRDKPGDGLGYGFGAAFRIPFGFFRLEMGFTDRGDNNFQFAVGDRF